MGPYQPKAIERKWQEIWEKEGMYRAPDPGAKSFDAAQGKRYILDMFPYPSGEGLHVGHPLGYIATDVFARYSRMRGMNVLHPMGWDAFGLPAENYALKHNIHPKIAVAQNIARFKEQLRLFGFSYDWSREINTTDPSYYKWTQWIFLKLFEKGLAYQAMAPVNFCPKDKTSLANEEVVNGRCERCGSVVERRMMRQWMLKITAYADKLLEGLETLDWPERIKEMQRNWIGRSEGAEIDFSLSLPVYAGEVAFATQNHGKLQRMQKVFNDAGLSVTLRSAGDIGIGDFHVREDGKTLQENAEKKARALAAHTRLPVFADDSGLFIDGVKLDPMAVKRNALNGIDERTLTVEQVGERMLAYYQELARSRGGFVDAEWRNAFCLLMPGKAPIHAESVRPVTLTQTPHGVVDPHLPLRPLYISKATGKYVLEQTEEEERIEMQPIREAVRKLFMPSITVFTTRPDTLFGATYLVLAPEHPFLEGIGDKGYGIKNADEVKAYVERAKRKSELERQEEKEKTGVRLEGIAAMNPVNNEELPVFVAEYVLGQYGTGAIMAVPAHDDRDFAFATQHQLPIREVVTRGGKPKIQLENSYTEDGILVNSGQFSGQTSAEARASITEWLTKQGKGGKKIHYKLRDWIFSRQRFWGEPIPLIHCKSCGIVPVSEKDLPVLLPDVERYESTGTGESPLVAIPEWLNVACPRCKGPAKRETNTMPQWAGSCWYYLRFLDPNNEKRFVDEKKERFWMPVDLYLGGAEHAVLHLLYARFWHKVLHEEGLVSASEPFRKLFNQGMILGPDHQKMSKSRGNVIKPDEIIASYGADTLRLYEMFLGPLETEKPWDTKGIMGLWRFLNRVYDTVAQNNAEHDAEQRRTIPRGSASGSPASSGEVQRSLANDAERMRHRTIKKVTEDIEAMKFNTAVAALMEFVNAVSKFDIQDSKFSKTLVLLLAPFAPHIAEELWRSALGNETSVHTQPWPAYDPAMVREETVTMVVQVNGRVRGQITMRRGATEAEARHAAEIEPHVTAYLANMHIQRTIFIQDRLINFVLRP